MDIEYDSRGRLFVRLYCALGILVFHAFLLTHTLAVALILINASDRYRYECVQLRRGNCVWLFGLRMGLI